MFIITEISFFLGAIKLEEFVQEIQLRGEFIPKLSFAIHLMSYVSFQI